MHIIFLSLPEKEVLRQHSQESSIKQIRIQSQAILMRDRGIDVSDISAVLFKNERTISSWLRKFVEARLSSIFSYKVGNENASKLTREQKEEIRKVVGQPPDEYGIPVEFWDVPKLKDYVEAVFDVVYESDVSYHFLLKYSGMSVKYPDVRSPRREEESIKRITKEIRKEIKPLLEDESWKVFASDETRLQKEAEIRRAWLVKGKRSVVKTERSKEHQNYLGFLDQKTYLCQVYPIKRGNTAETIRVLKKLIKQYPDKKICIIWDNARWHKSKELREELKKGKSLERIHFISLAPYAPETNPIEHVWGYVKAKLANKTGKPFEEITQEFIQLTNNQSFLYQI